MSLRHGSTAHGYTQFYGSIVHCLFGISYSFCLIRVITYPVPAGLLRWNRDNMILTVSAK